MGCKNYKCVPKYVSCPEIAFYCPDGELVTVGINDRGCPIQKCVYETEECNGHNLGETYLSKDGCNTCQCTIDGSGNIRELCTERSCEPIEEKECPQLGYREKGRYCNINYAWEEQRNGGEYCNNDFECSSNSCLDSQCTEPGFWTKLSKWLAKFLVNPN